jgi:hypothetical protein
MWARIPAGNGAVFRLERNRAPRTGMVPFIPGLVSPGQERRGVGVQGYCSFRNEGTMCPEKRLPMRKPTEILRLHFEAN